MTKPNMASIILAGAPAAEKAEHEGYDAEAHLHSAMEDFHRFASDKTPNYKGMASAFRSAVEALKGTEDDEEEAD